MELTVTDNVKRIDFIGVEKPQDPVKPINPIFPISIVTTTTGLLVFLFVKFFFNVEIRSRKKNGKKGRVLGRRRIKVQDIVELNLTKEAYKTTSDSLIITLNKTLALKLETRSSKIKILVNNNQVAMMDDLSSNEFIIENTTI